MGISSLASGGSARILRNINNHSTVHTYYSTVTMQAVCATSSFKGVSVVGKTPVARVAIAPAGLVCRAQSPVAKMAAAAVALPALIAAHPAFALVDDRLGGEGTGKILGIGGGEQYAVIGVFGLVWALYYAGTRDLGGDKGDDSGLTL